MFTCGVSDGYKDVLNKIKMKTLVYGDKTLMVEFQLAKGADLPVHQHPHEQTGYLVSGRIDLTMDGVDMPFVRGAAGASPVMTRIRPWRMPIQWPWKSLALSARIICADREEDAK